MQTLRSPIRATFLARTFASAFTIALGLSFSTGAHAVGATASNSEIQGLVRDARASIARLRQYIYAVEYDIARYSSQTDMRGARMMSNSPTYRDLDREASQLSSIASRISGVVSRCGKEGAKVGSDIKSAARRVKGSVERIASSSNYGSVQMATDKVRLDTDSAERTVGVALQMQGCVHEEDGDDDEDEDEESKKDSDDAEKPSEG